ncbi:MAG: DNA repair protein RecN [Eubacteriales bacterium]|nr:DNA repair protein RecN [Eubacteriales bacterium]MDY3333059.1 DNA repair protein RecN [Gallibacter sp.]
MIKYINIKNFTIIKDVSIDFYQGLNIMTGESGSGKSIVIEAISLMLGSRADTSFIRTGHDKALLQMVCDYENTDYILTRELNTSGKNICKINDEIVTLSHLQEFATKIADIHGQYDNQTLLNADKHIQLVDKYDFSVISKAKSEVQNLFNRYVAIAKNINDHREMNKKFLERKEFLEFELKEINDADLKISEDKDLQERLIEAENIEKVHSAFEHSSYIANLDDASALSQISSIQQNLKNVAGISREAKDLELEFSDIYYRLQETISRLNRVTAKDTMATNDIEIINDRLSEINRLKRKYGETIEQILDYRDKINTQLNKMSDINDDIDEMLLEKSRIGEMLKASTESLSTLRKRSASSLEASIQKELNDLFESQVQLKINVSQLSKYTANGIDKVEFLISTNPGEPLKPLVKVASGGEISRIMLAFKCVICEFDQMPSMIFDEIDTGISGKTAAIVGNKLLTLSKKHQIISITHLPQIAALADNNYKIVKTVNGFTTTMNISLLSEKEKIEEVARLLSAGEISDVALENAKQLIKN